TLITTKPWELYNLLCTNYPAVTVKIYDFNPATSNMVLKYSRVGSSGERYINYASANVLSVFTGFGDMTNSFEVSARVACLDWNSTRHLLHVPADAPMTYNKALTMVSKKLNLLIGTNGGYATISSTASMTFTNGQIGWCKATCEIVGSQAITKFYTGETPTNYTQLGSTITNADITAFVVPTITNTSQSGGDWIYAQRVSSANTNVNVYEIHWATPIGSQDLSHPIDRWIFVGANYVTVYGSPEFKIYNGSWNGSSFSHWSSNSMLSKIAPISANHIVVNLGLNTLYQYKGLDYYSIFSTISNFNASINTAYPNSELCYLSQNPLATTNIYYFISQQLGRSIVGSARKLNCGYIDNYSYLLKSGWNNSSTSDGTHPTAASQQTNGVYIYRKIFD
ncbi:MAG: hypothetical protein NTV06_06290, partial [candidate division Zixibacteria bacterium]|nr:hypothetical protein [candidate division Zixibacteria bacterium]